MQMSTIGPLLNFTLHPVATNFTNSIPENLSNSTTNNITTCEYKYHEWLVEKLILLSVCGSTVAAFGIFGNLTTALILTRPSMRSPNNLYLTALAVFDTCLLITAVLIYSVEYIIEYTENFEMYVAWLTYLRFSFALSHISQTGSVYITVAVTMERFMAVVYPERAKVMCTKRGASVSILSVTCFSILFNCTKFFELEIKRNPNCTRFSAYSLDVGVMADSPLYHEIYSLWVSNLVMVFIPFLTLFVLNSKIAWTIRSSLRHMSWAHEARGDRRTELKAKSRDATRVLVIIVLIFLMCNLWGFVITLMERIYEERLYFEPLKHFYTFSREAINFLAIVNSSINFVIYCIFGKDFRRELITIYGCGSGLSIPLPMEDKFSTWRVTVKRRISRRPSRPLSFRPGSTGNRQKGAKRNRKSVDKLSRDSSRSAQLHSPLSAAETDHEQIRGREPSLNHFQPCCSNGRSTTGVATPDTNGDVRRPKLRWDVCDQSSDILDNAYLSTRLERGSGDESESTTPRDAMDTTSTCLQPLLGDVTPPLPTTISLPAVGGVNYCPEEFIQLEPIPLPLSRLGEKILVLTDSNDSICRNHTKVTCSRQPSSDNDSIIWL